MSYENACMGSDRKHYRFAPPSDDGGSRQREKTSLPYSDDQTQAPFPGMTRHYNELFQSHGWAGPVTVFTVEDPKARPLVEAVLELMVLTCRLPIPTLEEREPDQVLESGVTIRGNYPWGRYHYSGRRDNE